MKGLKRLFIGCLAVFICAATCGAFADDSSDVARAATRRGATTTVTRAQSGNDTAEAQPTTTSGISRSTNLSATGVSVRDRTKSGTTTRTNVVVRDTTGARSATDTSQTVSARTTSTVKLYGLRVKL